MFEEPPIFVTLPAPLAPLPLPYPPLNITVVFKGETHVLEVDEDDTVETLQFQIFSLLELPPEEQSLSIAGREKEKKKWDPEARLKTVGVMENTQITISLASQQVAICLYDILENFSFSYYGKYNYNTNFAFDNTNDYDGDDEHMAVPT
eukprot:jgi/Bigna1/133201/aug1.20_g7909